MNKKVLIVEDSQLMQHRWHRDLGGKFVLIGALSIEEAEEKFIANPDIDAIVMDACVQGDSINTLPLVRKFRRTFAGPMIAISSSSEYRDMLVSAGCNYESSKDALPRRLLAILDL